jgi:hypothetical protein
MWITSTWISSDQIPERTKFFFLWISVTYLGNSMHPRVSLATKTSSLLSKNLTYVVCVSLQFGCRIASVSALVYYYKSCETRLLLASLCRGTRLSARMTFCRRTFCWTFCRTTFCRLKFVERHFVSGILTKAFRRTAFCRTMFSWTTFQSNLTHYEKVFGWKICNTVQWSLLWAHPIWVRIPPDDLVVGYFWKLVNVMFSEIASTLTKVLWKFKFF